MFVVPGSQLSTRQLHDLLEIRVDIFVVEQQCPYREIDGRDLEPSTEHLWLADDKGVASAIRVLANRGERRIGRVVTRSDRRGEGLAAELIATAVRRIGDEPIVLDAQSHLSGFYEGLGFVVDGDEFLEDGIPHVPMHHVRADAPTGGRA